MDYDDSDFQSQSFQLGGEDNKFSSGLRSFSLPKFDLDDNLQVHLRFDSLIESEVLLGIHNQEENHWIEDFSRVSSGLDANNVWSEATSSESVEMLLKSVGQDEMIMEQTIVEDTDTCDGAGILTEHMQPISVEGFPPSKVEDTLGDSALPSGSSREDPSSSDEKLTLVAIEGKSFINEKCSEAKQVVNVDSVVQLTEITEITEIGSKVDFSESSAHISICEGPSPSKSSELSYNVNSRSSEIASGSTQKINILDHITQGILSVEPSEKQGVSLEDNEQDLDGDISVSNNETETVENKTATVDQRDNLCNISDGNSSKLMVKAHSLTNSVHESQSTATVKDGNDGLRVLSADSREDTLISSPVQVESLLKADRNLEPTDVRRSCLEESAIEKENLIFPTDPGNKGNQSVGSLIMNEGELLSPLGQSIAAAGLILPSYGFVGIESVPTDDVPEFTNLQSNSTLDRISGKTEDNAVEMVVEKQPLLPVPDSALFVKEDTGSRIFMDPSFLVSTKSSYMANVSVPFPEFVKGSVFETEVADRSLYREETVNTLCVNEPQAQVDMISQLCSKKLEKCIVIHDFPIEDKDGAELCEKFEKVPIVASVVLSHNETIGQPISPSLKESSCHIGLKTVEDNKVSETHNGVHRPLASTEGNSLNDHEGSCNPATTCEDGAQFHVLEKRSSSSDANVPHCDSPTVFSCSNKVSQSEKVHCEGGQGSLDQIASVSDDSQEANKVGLSFLDPKENNASEDGKSFTFEVSSLSHLSERETSKGWKPFPNIQPYAYSSAVVVHPPTTTGLCQIDGNVLQERSHETPRTPSRKTVRRNSKVDDEGRTGQLSGKVAEKESAKVGKVRRETTHSKQKKARENTSFTTSTVGSITNSSSISTSNLPDLNTSTSPSPLLQQPFTDFQQVQLRAQIFVYGSLIQGAAPNEACMISAFGENVPDGGRSTWENVWRIAVEKSHNQKSLLSNPETPLPLKPSARALEQANRQSVDQSEALPTPVRDGSKGIFPANVNPVMQLSSPLWTISTPLRDGSQSSISMSRGPPVDSQQPFFPLHPYQSPHLRHFEGNSQHTHPWLSPVPSSSGAHYPSLPISETVLVTSIREANVPRPSMIPHLPLPSSPFVHTGAPVSVPSGTPLPMESIRTTISVDSNPKKRRKNQPSEDPGRSSSLIQPQTEPLPLNFTPSFSLTTPLASTKGSSASYLKTNSTTTSTNYQVTGGRGIEQRAIMSGETCSRIEQAQQQAEDAAAYAASAVSHSQSIWSQLAIQKNLGLVSDIEAKLASSAVAIAAAASVAKAAAAAAKVASDAALQAKMMADEALATSGSGNPNCEASLQMGLVSPGSILKGKESVLGATREIARKRVEAASAAAKRAENLNAVVKAAEIAAEAVSQAGTIIAMGEPFPLTLSELIEAGPEGYWKVQQTSSKQLVKLDNINREQGKLDAFESAKRSNELPSSERESTDLAKRIVSVPESNVGAIDASITSRKDYGGDMPVGIVKETIFTEGTLVEVLSGEEGLGRVWYPAKILSLEDGRANVCYTGDTRREGSGLLTELVSFEGEGGKSPRIRIAHPMSVMKYEGTKKRNRKVRGDYAWSVGDKVDAWINDGWREGVITEKGMDDETNITVQFIGPGETSTVKVWFLRPSLIWEDGGWMDWSVSMQNDCYIHEGVTSQEKPLKKVKHGYAEIDLITGIKGKGKLEPSQPLTLSAKERVFSAGQNDKDKFFDAPRTNRTGLVKEASGVVFGIPKPGKKRKLMDVSTQSVVGRSGPASEGNDSVKFTKHLVPQGSAPRGWKTASKSVSKGKQVTQLKPKVPRFGKPPGAASKTISEKESSSNYAFSATNHSTVQDHLADRRTGEGPASSVPSHSSDAPFLKKKSSSAVVVDHGNGKAVPYGEKNKIEETDAYYNDNSGTRRSNRRIQPTSRLLEGIQSSLTISKIPTVSHDKGTKSQTKSAFSRGTNHG